MFFLARKQGNHQHGSNKPPFGRASISLEKKGKLLEQARKMQRKNPDPPILGFCDFLAFFVLRFSSYFLVGGGPFFSKDLKDPCFFWWVFLSFFLSKKGRVRGSGEMPPKKGRWSENQGFEEDQGEGMLGHLDPRSTKCLACLDLVILFYSW